MWCQHVCTSGTATLHRLKTTMRKALACGLPGLLLCAQALAQSGTEPVLATDLLRIRQLSNVTASQDGRHIAYTVSGIVEDEESDYRYRSQIWIANVSRGEEPQQLTFSDAGASSPSWHPDSDRLVFVRPVKRVSQLFEISIYGGEARQLTNFAHGVSQPQWSPDGRRILFAASLSEADLKEETGDDPVWYDERPMRRRGDTEAVAPDPDASLESVRAWLSKNAQESNPRVFTRLNLQGERALQPKGKYNHYFVAEVSGEDVSITMVTHGYYSFGSAAWMPDSRQLVVSGYPQTVPHPDRERDRDLYLIDTDERRLRRLLDISKYSLSAPVVSPDGNIVSFLARDLDDPGYAQTELGLFALDGRSAPEMLTLDFDRSVSNVHWSADSWYVYFTAPSEGGFPLYRVMVDEGRPALPTPEPDTTAVHQVAPARDSYFRGELVRRGLRVERMTSSEHGIRSYDLTRATAFMVRTGVLNPYELYSSTMDFRGQRRLSNHNESWLQHKRLSLPAASYVQRDTLRVQYWVMPPAFQEPGRNYPLLVAIHGGPASMWGPGEATMWHEFQFLASKGYGIVYCNPRGSGGYGHDFKAANYQDWGEGPSGDVLAVAAEVARRHRWIDTNRQVVTGGSYAGYLTAYIVTQDHRFKAAVAQRGVYDLATFFGEGRAWRLVPNHFGGYPWEVASVLRDNSPQTWVDRITTPLLIIHADNDLRTGVIQSELLYKSLKALERPVEYVRYPNAGHDLSRTGNPKQRIDRLLRIWEFMERYTGNSR